MSVINMLIKNWWVLVIGVVIGLLISGAFPVKHEPTRTIVKQTNIDDKVVFEFGVEPNHGGISWSDCYERVAEKFDLCLISRYSDATGKFECWCWDLE